jgi:predicted dehydrogenase
MRRVSFTAMRAIRPNLAVGVIGAGSMGRHHVRIMSRMPSVRMVGLYDPDPQRSDAMCAAHGCTAFTTIEQLLDQVDAVSVAAPTSLHLEIGRLCLERGIHVLMEKPLAHNVEGAKKLVYTAANAGLVLMVGHVERYNPAVRTLLDLLHAEPEPIVSIDCRRLTPFDGTRCLDVDVLHDLLIHDVDLVLEIAGAPVSRVSAVGRPVFSSQTDVAHTRIDFANQATAVFWTGKCSPKKVRTLAVTTPSRYLEVDTLTRSLTVHTAEQLPEPSNGVCLMGSIRTESVPVPDEEPLWAELKDFVRAVSHGERPLVHGDRALAAMKTLDLVARSIASAGAVIEAPQDL